jgi:hypothetical protein
MLDLHINDVGRNGAQYLGEALKVNQVLQRRWNLMHLYTRRPSQTLTTLDLHSNKIGADGGLYLGEALRLNKVIQS